MIKVTETVTAAAKKNSTNSQDINDLKFGLKKLIVGN